jgi:F-type H+-transporting ATPase subunit epsilon
MNLTVVSPEGKIYNGETQGFVIDTISGQKTFLDRHADYISFFDLSKLTIISSKDQEIYVALGYIHIEDNKAVVIAQIASSNETKVKESYNKYKNLKERLQDSNG